MKPTRIDTIVIRSDLRVSIIKTEEEGFELYKLVYLSDKDEVLNIRSFMTEAAARTAVYSVR